MAEHITDPIAKQMILNVAAEYEQIAKRTEEGMASPSPQSK